MSGLQEEAAGERAHPVPGLSVLLVCLLPCVSRAVPCRAFGVPDTGLPTCPDDGGCLANSCCVVQPRLYREQLSPRRQGDEPPGPGPHVPPLLREPSAGGVWPSEVPRPLRTVGSPFLLSGSCRFARLPPGSIRVPAVQRWGWRRSGLSDAKPGLALCEQ